MTLDDLPVALRSLIQVASEPHPVLGTPCWLYAGKRWSRNGYGRVKDEGKERAWHRVVYTKLVGPIPEQHVLDHLCRCRACCRPDHVEPVTSQVNTRRGEAVLFGSRKSTLICEGGF